MAAVGEEKSVDGQSRKQTRRKISGAGRTTGENREKIGGQENGRRSFFGEATNSGENGKESCEKIASEQIVEGETKEFFGERQER